MTRLNGDEMEYEEVKALRESWGDKPCDHPDFADEILFGSKTGDYVCTQCGESFTKREKDALNRKGDPPKLRQLSEQNTQLKERIELLNSRKGQLEPLANDPNGHPPLDALLLEQKAVIHLIDELLEGLSSD